MLKSKLVLNWWICIYFILLFHLKSNSLSVSICSYESDGSFSFSKNVYMLISNPQNKKTGYNPFDRTWRREITGSSSAFDSITDIESNSPGPINFKVFIQPKESINGEYRAQIFGLKDIRYLLEGPFNDYMGYISSGTISVVSFNYDPTPGAPAPILKKEVTFQLLRDDINVAYKLNQIGEEKFANSLIKMINMAEKIYDKCEKTDKKDGEKKCYRSVISVLRMFVRRLEIANKKCDKSGECDEEKEWNNFNKKYRKDKQLEEFFLEWEKDEWHKYKKSCKRFVSEEALDIISSDVNWYVKAIGEEAWSQYKKEHKPYISSKVKEHFK